MDIIKSAVVMHNGWETDNLAWVQKTNSGELQLRTTTNNREVVMTEKELIAHIKETSESLEQLKELLYIITP
jgi:hypothetical protein